MQPGKPVKIIAKAPLPCAQRAAIAATILVMHRQQGQPDPALCGGGGDTPGHLRQIIIGRAVALMMEIVEFHAGGVACLQHFHLHQCGDGLHMIGRQLIHEVIHQSPPGPEIIRRIRSALLCQPGHGALKGMAVNIGRGGQQYAANVACGRGICGDRDNGSAIVHIHPHIAGPASAQQCGARPDCLHWTVLDSYYVYT